MNTRNSDRPSHYAASTMARTVSATSRVIISKNLRSLNRRRHWTQQILAKESGVSQSHISSILRGQVDATASVLEDFARAYKIPSYLLLIPNLPPELLDSTELPAMIERYVAHAAAVSPTRP